MDKGIFTDREKAMEANYFRQQDAKLLEKLRKGAKLDEIAVALAEKLQVDNPDLLAARPRPWRDRRQRRGLLRRAAGAGRLGGGQGFEARSMKGAAARARARHRRELLVLRAAREWLKDRPDDALFDAAIEAIKHGFAVLPLTERDERIKRLLDDCHKVAEASGNEFAKQLGLGDGVSRRRGIGARHHPPASFAARA